jgi:hypothetical protein
VKVDLQVSSLSSGEQEIKATFQNVTQWRPGISYVGSYKVRRSARQVVGKRAVWGVGAAGTGGGSAWAMPGRFASLFFDEAQYDYTPGGPALQHQLAGHTPPNVGALSVLTHMEYLGGRGRVLLGAVVE